MNSGSKISANLGRHTRTGGNAHGWLLGDPPSRSTLADVTIEKAWVAYFNTERPHQSLGMRPIERLRLAAPELGAGVERCSSQHWYRPSGRWWSRARQILRLPRVQRWVDQHNLISLGGCRYRVPIVLAGEPVGAVAANHLVRMYHRDVLVAEHTQRCEPDTSQRQGSPPA